MSYYLGIDSSNYTSSASVYDSDSGRVIANFRKLLPVAAGQLGLRQSDAVFHHVKNLPDIIEDALRNFEGTLSAVGVSVRPRDVDGSYMPCFLTGSAVARGIAAAVRIPVYEFSHQAGHIASALYSAGSLDLMHERFIAFHVSGGTTEAVLVTPCKDSVFKCGLIAESLDLKAGQAIDRVGGLLGLPFPSGPLLEELSNSFKSPIKVKPVLKGADCSVSGLQNQCWKMLESGACPEKIARYCIEFVSCTLDGMTEVLLKKYPGIPIVFAGGVMSNKMIKKRLSSKYGGIFAQPQYSSDNAAGIAVMAAFRNNCEI